MSKQCEFTSLPPKQKPEITAYEKRKWGKALNGYLLEQSQTVGMTNGWCLCGCMSFCDYCEDVRSCVAAVKKRARELNVELNYKDYDFEKLLREVEK